jgi:phosphoglycolate phosphatase-like HAD superfamily hydrolase
VILDRLGWSDNPLIDATICSDEVPLGRPHADMIVALMDCLSIPEAARVAKMGDTPADLLEGCNAGCRLIVGVTEGTHTCAELEPFPHTHLIGTVREPPDVLGLQ